MVCSLFLIITIVLCGFVRTFLVGLEQRDRYEEEDLRRRHDYVQKVQHIARRIPSSLRPTDSQPTLFWVRVDIGREREVLRRILERQKKFMKRGSTLLITSALTKENHPGMLYLEAMQQKYAQKALTGIPYVKGGGVNVRMINRDGVANILTVLPTITSLPQEMLARVRVGRYKGDLCQVKEMDESDPNMVTVFVVTREPTAGEDGKQGGHGQRRAQNFSASKFELRIKTSQLITKGINATPEELKKFFNNEVPSDVERMLPESQQRSFNIGDRVKITRGESRNLTGEVQQESGDKMIIRPDHPALKGRVITVYKRDVEKNFREGDHVTFTGDSGDKRTGMVVRVEGPHVRVRPDGEKEVVDTRSFDVDFCAHGSFVGSMAAVTRESIRVGNLVRTGANDAGLVLQISNGVLTVLGTHDTFERVAERDVGEKIVHRASTTDQKGRPITAREMVKIVEGKHRGRSGIIEHVFQDRVFVRSEKYTKNRGYFAVGGSECRRDGHVGLGAGGRERKHELVGKTVRVRKGPLKGSEGEVKRVVDDMAEVLLHQNQQIKMFKIEELVDPTHITQAPPRYDFGGTAGAGARSVSIDTNFQYPFTPAVGDHPQDYSYTTPAPAEYHTAAERMTTPYETHTAASGLYDAASTYQTPASSFFPGHEEGAMFHGGRWHIPGVLVQVNAGMYRQRKGVIRGVVDMERFTIEPVDGLSSDTFVVAKELVDRIMPQINDRVIVLDGSHESRIGRCEDIHNGQATVVFDGGHLVVSINDVFVYHDGATR
eukprot:TRINITY_DN347_c0_g1_i2.p1 TRINITY_DN347_c0_g1~~TRINITY_DN347_c0_g1_i2.p1  ORF type:complete len:785 (+),score=195.96 TRINITY_DN347_c0_g1_i2:36-2357(+)